MNYFELPLFSPLSDAPDEGIHRSDNGEFVCLIHADLDTVKLAMTSAISFGAQKTSQHGIRLFFSFGTSLHAHTLVTLDCPLASEDLDAFISQEKLFLALAYSIDDSHYFGFIATFKPDPAIVQEMHAMKSPDYIMHRTIALSTVNSSALAHGLFHRYDFHGDARPIMKKHLNDHAFGGKTVSVWFTPASDHICIFSIEPLRERESSVTITNIFTESAIPFGFTDGEGTVFICALDKKGIEQCAEKGNRRSYENIYSVWN